MSPALNGSSAIQCFEGNDAIEICDGITFDYCTGLPHICSCTYVCVFTGDVPQTPLSPFEPHSTAIFSPTLRFTVKMERGIATLTKATDSLTPQVRGMMGGWEGEMGGRWRGGGWRVDGGKGWWRDGKRRRSCFYLGGQNKQLRSYQLTCVANV